MGRGTLVGWGILGATAVAAVGFGVTQPVEQIRPLVPDTIAEMTQALADTIQEGIEPVAGAVSPPIPWLVQPLPRPAQVLLQPLSALAQAVPQLQPLAEQLLAHAGPGQGELREVGDRCHHPARLLIHDAVGAETPTAGARQAGITAGHQVVLDAAVPEVHHRIGHRSQGQGITTEQLCLEEGGQAIQGVLVRGGAITAHGDQIIGKVNQLIEAPDSACRTEGTRAAGPAQQAMAGGIHPGKVPHTLVAAVGPAHTATDQIAHKQLVGGAQTGFRNGFARASPDTGGPGRSLQVAAQQGWWRC